MLGSDCMTFVFYDSHNVRSSEVRCTVNVCPVLVGIIVHVFGEEGQESVNHGIIRKVKEWGEGGGCVRVS